MLRRLGLPPMTQPRAGDAVADVLASPYTLAPLIEQVSPAEREVLDLLAAGPPVGVVRDALVPAVIAGSDAPPHRLIGRGLLVPIDAQTVELPREVGRLLRGAGRATGNHRGGASSRSDRHDGGAGRTAPGGGHRGRVDAPPCDVAAIGWGGRA